MKHYQLLLTVDTLEVDRDTLIQFEKDIKKRLDSVIKAHFPTVEEVWIKEFYED